MICLVLSRTVAKLRKNIRFDRAGYTMSKKLREIVFGGLLMLISTAVVVGVCEAFFRFALFSDGLAIPTLRQSWRYADSAFEDDYWKLTFLFRAGEKAQRVGNIDPELGWSPPVSSENPLGLISDTPYRVEDIRRPILFYGDSFVAGASPIPQRIPQIMDRLLEDRTVLNYGVGGYGVDQIYLRYRKTAGDFQAPLVLIGMLTSDLDRSILGMRTGQKPYFDIEDAKLVTRNLPILASTREYIDRNPPRIRSYFLRFVMFRLRPYLPPSWFDSLFGFDAQHQRKLGVNSRVLQAFREDAETLGIPLHAVIFYSEEEFAEPTWREKFLQQTLDEQSIKYFDTKAYLKAYMSRTGATLDALYYADNGHPNEAGNRVIATGIAEWLGTL